MRLGGAMFPREGRSLMARKASGSVTGEPLKIALGDFSSNSGMQTNLTPIGIDSPQAADTVNSGESHVGPVRRPRTGAPRCNDSLQNPDCS
jgi:hypothetical protein